VEVYPYGISRFLVWGNAIAPRLIDIVITRFLRQRTLSARANAGT
jgi:hypothetical protein